ncbi:hypothetical protein ACRYCC_25410 [Actinomadura scrupuli]|uniref:hypothetical protein n=1 Tax=Actinomadura scrupuli TaxID=559629 RepID=UPI003D970085
MSTSPGQASGRHAKPPSKFATTCDEAIRTLSGKKGVGRLVVAGTGAGAVVLAGTVVTLALSAGGGHTAPPERRVARPATPAAVSSQVPAGTLAADGTGDDPAAIDYFRSKDAKVAGHVERVSRDGQFLRVYTDYPEEDANSASAISLCDWTSELLKSEGDPATFVFIHGTSTDNGSVVLANKVSPTDSCKVDETK